MLSSLSMLINYSFSMNLFRITTYLPLSLKQHKRTCYAWDSMPIDLAHLLWHQKSKFSLTKELTYSQNTSYFENWHQKQTSLDIPSPLVDITMKQICSFWKSTSLKCLALINRGCKDAPSPPEFKLSILK